MKKLLSKYVLEL